MSGATVAHSPGPWEFHDDGGTWQIADSDNRPICLIRHGVTDEARQLANARLIAAAPDGLSAAKFALSVLQANPVEMSERMAIEKLEAFIAKATGAV